VLLPDDWIDRDLVEIACLAPLQEVYLPQLESKCLRLFVKREDMLHSYLGGNKLYKLHGYLCDYRGRRGKLPLATFGGAYSNHILALASAAHMCDIPSIGVIRGYEPDRLSATLQDAKSLGMHLEYVSREDYRRRHSQDYLRELERTLGACYWIPEGGAGVLGARGCIALAEGITRCCREKPDAIFHACGTGASVAGLVAGFARQPVGNIYNYGVSVLKGQTEIFDRIHRQITVLGAESQTCWRVLDDYHCGGYARYPEDLAFFVRNFEAQTNVLLDPVYTSKVMWAIIDLVEKDFFSPGSSIVAVHSGGLQGRRGCGLDFNAH